MGDKIGKEEIELLAMFAGSTMQTLQSMNVPNLPPARALVNEALKGMDLSNKTTPSQPRVATPQPQPQPAVELTTSVQSPEPVSAQFELDLFRKMDMSDVYKILSRIEETMETLVKVNKQILAKVSVLDTIGDT